MRIDQILTLAIILGTALPATAQVPWDMAPTSQVAPEFNQSQWQSPANASSALGGATIAAPQNAGGFTYSGQQALNSGAAVGSLGNRAINGYGYNPTQVANPTQHQTQGLSLPACGTMGLAPVFGTGNDGFTSLGGYVPPMIYIPGVGNYRIPSTVGLGGLGSIQLPQLNNNTSNPFTP